jgi:hypothetical protein
MLGPTVSTQQRNAKKHYSSLNPSNVKLNIPKLSCVLPSDAAEHLLYILLQKKYCKPMTHIHLHYYDTNGCQFQVLSLGLFML